jgi:hypothetical protein
MHLLAFVTNVRLLRSRSCKSEIHKSRRPAYRRQGLNVDKPPNKIAKNSVGVSLIRFGRFDLFVMVFLSY